VFLNLVAGTSTADRLAVGDEVDHDRRYTRLREYGQIILGLLGREAPLTVQGEFYQLRGARLRLPGPAERRPVLFIAGQSPAARDCASALGAVHVGRFDARPPTTRREESGGVPRGAYAGLIVRDSDEEAWRVARERYPADPDLESAGAAALRYTDAVWRHQAFAEAYEPAPGWYWRGPMRSMRADCPFLVGGVQTLAPMLAANQAAGLASLIVDLAPLEEDFRWTARLLSLAAELAEADRTAGVDGHTPSAAQA
jgi:alkanesulfonate monooxygenase